MQPEPKIPLIVRHLMSEIQPVGSRVTCDPAPTDTDEDFLVAISPLKIRNACLMLEDDGWTLSGSDTHNPKSHTSLNKFYSYKRGDINLILTADRSFFDRFMAASSVAKRLNLLNKLDRVALFQAVLYGNPYAEPVNPMLDMTMVEL